MTLSDRTHRGSVAGRLASGHRFGIWLIVGLALIIASLSLGRRDLWSPDEPKYALVAQEMITSGEWLIPHVNGRLYPDKPPLFFWSIAAASLLFGGVGQSAAVFPSIVAGVVVLLATARLTHLLAPDAPRWAPVLAVGMLAVTYRFAQQMLHGQIDMLLTACTTTAFLFLVCGSGFAPKVDARRRHLVAGFALMGLANLAKGPVGLLIPLGGLLVGARLAHRDRGEPRLSLRRRLIDPRAWWPLILVPALWLVPAAIHAFASGQEIWLSDILFKQTAVRYANSWHHHQPVWYFLIVPLYDMLPIVWLLPAAIPSLWKTRTPESYPFARKLLAGVFLFAIVFFSIPSGKRGLYLLPAYPMVAVWLSLDLAHRLQTRGRSARSPRFAGAVLACLAGTIATVLLVRPLIENFAEENQLDVRTWFLALPLSLIALAGAFLAWRGADRWSLSSVGLAMGSLYLILAIWIHPALDPLKSARPFLQEARSQLIEDASAGIVDFRAEFAFPHGGLFEADPGDAKSLDAIAQRLAGRDAFWLMVREKNLESILRRIPESASVVEINRRRIGDKVWIALANPAALRNE